MLSYYTVIMQKTGLPQNAVVTPALGPCQACRILYLQIFVLVVTFTWTCVLTWYILLMKQLCTIG